MTNKLVQGNDKLAPPPIFISEYDLQDEDIQVCIEALGLEEVLYQIGFDKERWVNETDSFYEVMECEHRSRSGKIVKGKRYIGSERTDRAWLDSGLASEDAKMVARKDISYLNQIKEISKRSR